MASKDVVPVEAAVEEYPVPTGEGWPYTVIGKAARKRNDDICNEICRLTKSMKKGGIADHQALQIAVHLLEIKVGL